MEEVGTGFGNFMVYPIPRFAVGFRNPIPLGFEFLIVSRFKSERFPKRIQQRLDPSVEAPEGGCGEEWLSENEREGRAMEGIRADEACMPHEVKKLRRSCIEDPDVHMARPAAPGS